MPETRFNWLDRERWLEYLLAIVIGNAVYFLLLEPLLPAAWQHEPFRVDRGLAVDFLVCIAVFILLRHWKRLRKQLTSDR